MDPIELDEVTERVLSAADRVPAGKVASYGDIGEVVGVGPRQVGRIMATHGHLTCWWRVLRADGTSAVAGTARRHWDEEGIGYHDTGRQLRVDMSRYRWSGQP